MPRDTASYLAFEALKQVQGDVRKDRGFQNDVNFRKMAGLDQFLRFFLNKQSSLPALIS
jgi:hypothetical protein